MYAVLENKYAKMLETQKTLKKIKSNKNKLLKEEID
jgi:hypothetical protein